MKIVDAFMFYNELELLNYRLNLLNNVVDYFVLVESTRTFRGNEKPLFYACNKHLFEKFAHKIIHVVVTDLKPFLEMKNTKSEKDLNSYPNEFWKNENHQRNGIDIGIQQLNLEKEDYIIVSDCDEIPDTIALRNLKYSEKYKFQILALAQEMYYYNLESKLRNVEDVLNNDYWCYAKIMTYEYYVNVLHQMPNNCRFQEAIDGVVLMGGWHLSYFGDAKKIRNKMAEFPHQELNTTENKNELRLIECVHAHKIHYHKQHDGNEKIMYIQNIPITENTHLPPLYDVFLTPYFSHVSPP